MRTLTKLCTLFFFLVAPFISQAQKYWETSLGLGYSNYMGDMVKPMYTFKEAHPAVQLNLRRVFDGRHSLRLGVLYAKISGDDKNYESLEGRGVSFENSILEFSFTGELDLMGFKRFRRNGDYTKTTSFYLFVGTAVAIAKPEVTYSDPRNVDAYIDYPKLIVASPLGIGMKKDLNEQIYLGAEFGVRPTVSDFLDGVQESGNPYFNDVYVFAGLTVGYRFLERTTSPKNE